MKFKKIKIVSFIITLVLVFSNLPSILVTGSNEDITPLREDNLDFGVSEGIEWKRGIFAPFADMGAWVTDPKYSNSGALNLGEVMQETGVMYFNLGFINAVDNTVENSVLNWGFGGYSVLNEDNPNNAQYNGIKKAITDVRNLGGDIVISIGGLNERNLFQHTNDLNVLVNTYIEIIDGFNLTRIDLDIEGGAQGYEMNKLNAQAIKIVQDRTDVEVVITLPVLPTGLTENLALPTVEAYLDASVDIEIINIMAMCYGSYFGDYGIASIKAIDSTMEQIKQLYAEHGLNLTDDEAYQKIGITTSIGFEGAAHPVFTTTDSQLVVDYAQQKQLGMVSFWSINRDSKTQINSGINNKYEHTEIYNSFMERTITPEKKSPVINGVTNKTIELGDKFNTLVGVTATDKEAVDLTNKIKVSGIVNSNKAGKYTITYSVTDSYGLKTIKTSIITVNDKFVQPPIESNIKTWTRQDEIRGLHISGIKVIHQGKIYEQISNTISWWNEPGTNSTVWKEIGIDENYIEPPLKEWNRNDESKGLYTHGIKVTYKGKIYKQISKSTAWWAEPSTNSSVWLEI